MVLFTYVLSCYLCMSLGTTYYASVHFEGHMVAKQLSVVTAASGVRGFDSNSHQLIFVATRISKMFNK